MSLRDRIKSWFASKREPEPTTTTPTPAPASDATKDDPRRVMRAAILEKRWNDALEQLRAARETALEAPVLDAALMAMSPVRLADSGPELAAFQLCCGEILAARGERDRSIDMLSGSSDTAALLLSADLLVERADEERHASDLDAAMALLDRAMRQDIDAPGVRERWARLRGRLGRADEPGAPELGATLLAPQRKLPFTLIRELARGGGGVVYEAREDLGSFGERNVALKLVHDRVAQRAQLIHEARVASLLRGAGVVAVFDVDADEGWLSMMLAEGGSLRARIASGSAPAIARWLPALLDVLAELHAHQWVHGDVKPANVLFADGERPLLGDFGLARRIGEPATEGSAGYVSPERRAGRPNDPRDDVYGIGRTLQDALAASKTADARLAALAARFTGSLDVRPADAAAARALIDT